MSTMILHSRQNLSCLRLSKDILFFQQKRYKHKNAHRTIAVKLLQDIPGVGERYSIQSVAPGRMRHVFYPRKQAAYITERQAKNTSTTSLQQPRMESSILKDRLLSLEPLVFQRAAQLPETLVSTESTKLNGPITTHDIIQRLAEHSGLDLAPLNARIVFQNSSTKDRIESTGEHHVFVHLSTGDILPIKVLIKSEINALKPQTAS